MPVELYRVDNRLVHGQVLEAWLPKVRADAILVVDDDVSADPFQKCVLEAMGQSLIRICVVPTAEAMRSLDGELAKKRVIVLFKSLEQALAAYRSGMPMGRLNLGNIHPSPEARSLSPSVNLSPEDVGRLKELIDAGVKVDARAVPCESGPDVARFCQGSTGA